MHNFSHYEPRGMVPVILIPYSMKLTKLSSLMKGAFPSRITEAKCPIDVDLNSQEGIIRVAIINFMSNTAL
jgi:hypothetical protein